MTLVSSSLFPCYNRNNLDFDSNVPLMENSATLNPAPQFVVLLTFLDTFLNTKIHTKKLERFQQTCSTLLRIFNTCFTPPPPPPPNIHPDSKIIYIALEKNTRSRRWKTWRFCLQKRSAFSSMVACLSFSFPEGFYCLLIVVLPAPQRLQYTIHFKYYLHYC